MWFGTIETNPVCVCTFVLGFKCVCLCLWNQRPTSGIIFQVSCTLVFEAAFHWTLGLSNWSRLTTCVHFPSAGITIMCHHMYWQLLSGKSILSVGIIVYLCIRNGKNQRVHLWNMHTPCSLWKLSTLLGIAWRPLEYSFIPRNSL